MEKSNRSMFLSARNSIPFLAAAIRHAGHGPQLGDTQGSMSFGRKDEVIHPPNRVPSSVDMRAQFDAESTYSTDDNSMKAAVSGLWYPKPNYTCGSSPDPFYNHPTNQMAIHPALRDLTSIARSPVALRTEITVSDRENKMCGSTQVEQHRASRRFSMFRFGEKTPPKPCVVAVDCADIVPFEKTSRQKSMLRLIQPTTQPPQDTDDVRKRPTRLARMRKSLIALELPKKFKRLAGTKRRREDNEDALGERDKQAPARKTRVQESALAQDYRALCREFHDHMEAPFLESPFATTLQSPLSSGITLCAAYGTDTPDSLRTATDESRGQSLSLIRVNDNEDDIGSVASFLSARSDLSIARSVPCYNEGALALLEGRVGTVRAVPSVTSMRWAEDQAAAFQQFVSSLPPFAIPASNSQRSEFEWAGHEADTFRHFVSAVENDTLMTDYDDE